MDPKEQEGKTHKLSLVSHLMTRSTCFAGKTEKTLKAYQSLLAKFHLEGRSSMHEGLLVAFLSSIFLIGGSKVVPCHYVSVLQLSADPS